MSLKTIISTVVVGLLVAGTIYGATLVIPQRGGTGSNITPTKGDLLIGASATQFSAFGIGDNGEALVASSSQTLGVTWETVSGGGGGEDNIIWSTSSSPLSAYLTDLGRQLGVGTTSPQELVTIYNATTSRDIDLFRVSSTTQDAFVIDKSGNVGIGTDSPGTLLSLSGSGSANGITFNDTVVLYSDAAERLRISDTGGGSPSGLYLGAGTLTATALIADGASNINIGNGNDDINFDSGSVFIESDNGNLGIATTTPATKLDVNGTTTIRGSLVVEATTTIATKVLNNYLDFYNGSFTESFNATTSSDGTDITMGLVPSSGSSNNLTMRFSSGDTTLVTPTSTILTAGTDNVPQSNWVYIPESTMKITTSTVSWPTEEHIKISFFSCQSASSTQVDGGCLINQNWNDHADNGNEQGHMSHMGETIRLGRGYNAGMDAGGTDQSVLSSYFDYIDVAESYLRITSGVMYQMHKHSTPAFNSASSSDDIHVINWSGDAYHDISNLAEIVADSAGGSLSNKYFNVFFFVVGNKTGEYAPVMMQLPNGSYNSQSGVENDTSGFDVTSMPREFQHDSGTGVPIARLTLRWTGGLGTLTHISTKDCRETRCAGGGGAGGTGSLVNFSDSLFTWFDDADVTKIVDVQLSGLTTGNTRTVTMQDSDGTMCLLEATQQFTGVNTYTATSTQATTTFTGPILVGEYWLGLDDGTSGQVQKTDGSGNVTWQDDSTGSANPNARWTTTTDNSAMHPLDVTWEIGIGTTTPKEVLTVYSSSTSQTGDLIRFATGSVDSMIIDEAGLVIMIDTVMTRATSTDWSVTGNSLFGNVNELTVNGGWTWSIAQDLNNVAFTNINVDSGAIDGTPIGASSASTGVFTQATSTDHEISTQLHSLGTLIVDGLTNLASTTLTLLTAENGTFNNATTTNLTIDGITGDAQSCLQVDATGLVSGTGSACGGAAAADEDWFADGTTMYSSTTITNLGTSTTTPANAFTVGGDISGVGIFGTTVQIDGQSTFASTSAKLSTSENLTTNNASSSGDLFVGGNVQFTNALLDAYVDDALTIAGGTVNSSAIGASSASTAEFTNATTTRLEVATSLKIPNAADPVLNSVGEIGFDTTDNTLQIHDGSSEKIMGYATKSATFVIYADDDWASEAIPFWQAPADMAVTVQAVDFANMSTGGFLTFNIEERAVNTLNSAGTDIFPSDLKVGATSTATSSFSNASIAARAHLVLTTAATPEVGTVDVITGIIYYQYNVE